jgi:hypothetical protein
MVLKDTPRAAALAVDVQLQLRRVFQAVRAHAGQHLALHGHAQQLVARGQQGLVALAGAVLQAEAEAGGRAQLGDGRRAEREDEGVADAHQRPEGAAGQGLGRVLGPLRSSQSLSGTKARAAFWPEPENEKPSTPTTLSTSGCLRKNCSTCSPPPRCGSAWRPAAAGC